MSSTIFTAQKVIDGSVRGGAQKKGGENSPISPPLDPRLTLPEMNALKSAKRRLSLFIALQ